MTVNQFGFCKIDEEVSDEDLVDVHGVIHEDERWNRRLVPISVRRIIDNRRETRNLLAPLHDARVDDDQDEMEMRKFIAFVAKCLDGWKVSCNYSKTVLCKVYDYQNNNHRLAVYGAKRYDISYKMEPVAAELYIVQEQQKLEDLSESSSSFDFEDFKAKHLLSSDEFKVERSKPVLSKTSVPTFGNNLNLLNQLNEKSRKHLSDPSLTREMKMRSSTCVNETAEAQTEKSSVVTSGFDSDRKASNRNKYSGDSISSMLSSLMHWRRKMLDLAAILPKKRRGSKSAAQDVVNALKNPSLMDMGGPETTGCGSCENMNNVAAKPEQSKLAGLSQMEFVDVFEGFVHPKNDYDLKKLEQEENRGIYANARFLPDREDDICPMDNEDVDFVDPGLKAIYGPRSQWPEPDCDSLFSFGNAADKEILGSTP